MAFGGGVPTNNDLVNEAPRKDARRGTCLRCLHGGIRRGSTPPNIGGRTCSQRERKCGGEVTIVTISLYSRGWGMVHKKLRIFFKNER